MSPLLSTSPSARASLALQGRRGPSKAGADRRPSRRPLTRLPPRPSTAPTLSLTSGRRVHTGPKSWPPPSTTRPSRRMRRTSTPPLPTPPTTPTTRHPRRARSPSPLPPRRGSILSIKATNLRANTTAPPRHLRVLRRLCRKGPPDPIPSRRRLAGPTMLGRACRARSARSPSISLTCHRLSLVRPARRITTGRVLSIPGHSKPVAGLALDMATVEVIIWV